jgi:mono/diheme cytochrome c family protein
MHKFALAILLCAVATPAFAQDAPHFGTAADPARIKAWDISIAPDGTGLPPGKGSVAEGLAIYSQKCVMCHGVDGVGKPADRLTGGVGTLSSPAPVKTVASYWPYATTLFDYIRRAMPVVTPRTLTDHETYALVAYILSVDGIVTKDATLDARSLPKIRMPNRDGFIDESAKTR